MILPNNLGPIDRRADAPDDTAAYMQRVLADAGTIAGGNQLISSVNKLKIPNSMGANAFDSASLVLDAAGGVKTGKIYALKPHTGAGDFSMVRGTTKTATNAAGNLVTLGINDPPIDYDIVTGRWFFRPETAATNQIRNNTMVGAVAGTPGTLPTNWGPTVTAGLTRQVVGTGMESGIEYIDLRLTGTATQGTFQQPFEANTQIVAEIGQQWVGSFYARIISQPLPPLSYRSYVSEHNSGGSELTGGSLIQSITTNSFQRFEQTRVLNNASTARVNVSFLATLTIGQSYDFTIRIGLPQMGLGSVATSVIRTTGSIATRNADDISLTGVSSLIGQLSGSLYAEVNIQRDVIGALVAIDDGDSSDFIAITKSSTRQIRAQIRRASGSIITIITSAALSVGVHKIALSYQNGNYALYIDGALAGTSTNSTDYPATTLTRVVLSNTTYGPFNDRIRAAALYTTRLSNAELAQLTTL